MRGKADVVDGIALRRSRQLRSDPPDAEKKLWSAIRGRRFKGLKFRRQVRVGPYIADFCCIEKRLVVELDGGQHSERSREDAERTAAIEKHRYRVIRFWNDEVLKDLEGTLDRIRRALAE